MSAANLAIFQLKIEVSLNAIELYRFIICTYKGLNGWLKGNYEGSRGFNEIPEDYGVVIFDYL